MQSRNSEGLGVVTLIQRFGSALNLNIRFHILFLDGVYLDRSDGTRFHWQILNHLKEKGEYQDAFRLPESRGPPQTNLFG